MTLDAASAALVQQAAEQGDKPLHELSPEEARAVGGRMREFYGPGPDMESAWSVALEVGSGAHIELRVLKPLPEPRGVIVYLHGGGWLMGKLDEFDTLCRKLAARSGYTVVMVDYRLAPEHRFPAAVEDAWNGLRWASGHHANQLAAPGAPLIVAGDSAGGNLAAVLARRARDAGGPNIAMQVLVYPITDCNFERESYLDPQNQLLLSRDTMVWFWDHYVPDPAARAHPDASPLHAGDLSGLPPAVVLTAEHDPLRDDGEAYVERLRDAGVPVDHRRFDGQLHGFFTLVNVVPGSDAGLAYVAEAIDRLHVSV